jgi:hypothetical protein
VNLAETAEGLGVPAASTFEQTPGVERVCFHEGWIQRQHI